MAAMWCAYDGRGFRGYQAQQGHRTVQGELLKAFAALGLPRNPVAAARTDREVSARMQVLSGRLPVDVPLETLAERLNAALPVDLRVECVRPAPPGFHAAWSSNGKEYHYSLDGVDLGDRARFVEAARLVPGTRDFRVFHFKTSEAQPRTVREVELIEGPTLRFEGVSFARHMVRMLTGGLLAVGRGEVSLDTFRRGLDEQQNFHCPTADASRLTLWSVSYPGDVDPFALDRAMTRPALLVRDGSAT